MARRRRAVWPRQLFFSSQGRGFVKTCVFAKRTHRFCAGKLHLSGRATMGYTIKSLGKTVGSFWKTNPPEGCFWWGSVAPAARIRRVSSDSAWKTNPPEGVFCRVRRPESEKWRRIGSMVASGPLALQVGRSARSGDRRTTEGRRGRQGQPSLPLMGTGVFLRRDSFRILGMRLTG